MPTPTPSMAHVDRIAIVVPARDEAATVADALLAIRNAVDRAVGETPLAVELTVVDDGSVDGTGDVSSRLCSEFGFRSQVIRVEEHCVGAARRIGIDAATSTWRRPERAWVLCTDADSTVRPDWIVRHLRHARRGAVAVSGIVDIVADSRRSPLHARWWADYGAEIDRFDHHPYAHATNLGVRLDTYRDVGGFRDVAGGEDTDLWCRLRLAGHHPVADARIIVDTSDRRVGRVSVGFAWALDRLYPDPAAARPPAAAQPAAGT